MKTISIAFIILLVTSTYSTKINFDILKKWNEKGLEAIKNTNNDILTALEKGEFTEAIKKGAKAVFNFGKSVIGGIAGGAFSLFKKGALGNSKLEELIKEKPFPFGKFFSSLFTKDEALAVALEIEEKVREEYKRKYGNPFLGGLSENIQNAEKEEIIQKTAEFVRDYQAYSIAGDILKDFGNSKDWSVKEREKIVDDMLNSVPIRDIQDFAIKIIDLVLSVFDKDELTPNAISIINSIKKDIRRINHYKDIDHYMSHDLDKHFNRIEREDIPETPKHLDRLMRMFYTACDYGFDLGVAAFYGKFASHDELRYYMLNVTQEEAIDYAFKIENINFKLDNRSPFPTWGKSMKSFEEDKENNENILERLRKLSREELAELVVQHAIQNPSFTLISFVRRVKLNN